MLRSYWFVLLLSTASALLGGCPAPAVSSLQADMAPLLKFLDSPAYMKRVSWGEHVVLCYQLTQGRLPTLEEFTIVTALMSHPTVTRSEIFGIALAGDAPSLGEDKCRAFLAAKGVGNFETNPDVARIARELASAPNSETARALNGDDWDKSPGKFAHGNTKAAPNESYGTYFGFLHAHSHLSLDADPSGSPESAYATARESGMDFMGLTDHDVFLVLWPWDNKWQRLHDAADAADAPGEFVALAGFEWSNPLLGHISILNTEDFTHTLRTIRLTKIYDWIAARPEAYAQFNHPGDYDYLGIEFRHFSPQGNAVAQLVGIEIWNTNHDLEDYFYSGVYGSPLSSMDLANQQGWRVGALGAQDNHRSDWGYMNDFRTGVLATELTREGLVEAFRARRFYATEDKDLELDFRLAGYPMGAEVEGGAKDFTVTMHDRSGETFNRVRLFKNGNLFDTRAVQGRIASAEFSDPSPDEAYYYIIVTQDDDNDSNGRNDEAVSSSIWYTP